MKTQEQKLQHVKEVAGECWHEYKHGYNGMDHGWRCAKCDQFVLQIFAWSCGPGNPPPDDLNELFRLAEKTISLHNVNFDSLYLDKVSAHIIGNVDTKYVDEFAEGKTLSEALLNALYLATGGEE